MRELCPGEAVGEPQHRTRKEACLEAHKDPDHLTFLWPLQTLKEPLKLRLQKLDPGLA